MHERKVLLGIALAVALAACSDDDPAAPKVETYTATLNSANEVPTASAPAFPSNATGTAVVTVQGNTINWTVTTTGFGAGTTGPGGAAAPPAHIHFGGPTVNGGVMVNLSAAINGTSTGTTTVVDSVLTHLRAGNTYANVHTSNRSAGEIRGQLVRTQ